jgi:hypothetical protein
MAGLGACGGRLSAIVSGEGSQACEEAGTAEPPDALPHDSDSAQNDDAHASADGGDAESDATDEDVFSSRCPAIHADCETTVCGYTGPAFPLDCAVGESCTAFCVAATGCGLAQCTIFASDDASFHCRTCP